MSEMISHRDEPASQTRKWHTLALGEVLDILGTTSQGLDSALASARLETVGPNAMPTAPPMSRLRVLADQCRSIIALLLLAAGIVSALTGDLTDAAAIAAVLVLNIGIGYVMEIGAHRAVEALTSLEAHRATVIRDGISQDIDARTVVPGDVIIVEEGQAIPADGRLLDAVELRVVEASLTGESVPVTKRPDAVVDADAALPDRANMLYVGTTIATGRGTAVVDGDGRGRPSSVASAPSSATQASSERRSSDGSTRLDVNWCGRCSQPGRSPLFWPGGSNSRSRSCCRQALRWRSRRCPKDCRPSRRSRWRSVSAAWRAAARSFGGCRRSRRWASVTVICTDKTGTLTAGAMTVTRSETAAATIVVTGEGYAPEGSSSLRD